MATTSSTNAAVSSFIRDAELAHQIVHGTDTTVVETDGGPVDSYSKMIADLKTANSDAAAGFVPNLLVEIEVALDSALAAEAGALAYLNDFKGRYYGALAADPTLDPLGAAPTTGDMYFNSVSNALMVYRAGVWVDRETAAATSAAASEVSKLESEVSRLASGVSAGASATAKTAAEAARDAAMLSRGIFEATAKALSKGVASTASLVGGSGGTNGTFDIGFSGGAGSGAAGRFVVAGNTVVSTVITATGDSYTSAPSISFAASAGLTGASATAVIANNVDVGEYFSVLSGDLATLILYTNTAGSAVEVTRYYTKAYLDSLFKNGFAAERIGYLYAWVDSAGLLLLGIKTDGTLWAGGHDVNYAATALSAGPVRSNYLHVFTDSAARILGGFLRNGEFEAKGVNLSSSVEALSGLTQFASAPASIYAWGDSLTENGTVAGGWCVLLAAALARTVNSRGLGGQTAQQIVGRQGSYLTTVTVTGNQIPASGPVNIAVSNGLLTTSGTVATLTCEINGVPGTLSKSGAQYIFTRTAAGDATTVYPGTTLEVDVAVDAKYSANVIWVGRNHFNFAQTIAQYDAQIVTVLDAIGKAVNSLNPLNSKCLIVGVTNGSTEPIGTDGYNAILSCNAQIQARWPKQYLDIRTVLLESGTGAGQDATDYANGVIPTSLRADTQHLSAAGNAVVATAFQEKLSYLGI